MASSIVSRGISESRYFMKPQRLLLSIILLAAAGCSEHPVVRESPRYRIVQSTLAAKWTFRLDMRTGHVAQLVQVTKEGDLTWEDMPIAGLPPAADNGEHYQLFTSGIAAKFTFLMNTDTGKTWQLESIEDPATKEETYSWAQLP